MVRRLSIILCTFLLSSNSLLAADLGGNCCADLEERVAELEATTVRSGNQNVFLEISGHVHEALLVWDDSHDRGAYILTSNFSRSRFRFKGEARISADVSAGYLVELGLRKTGDSSTADQGYLQNLPASSDGIEQLGNPDGGIDIRHQALYIKSKRLGTVWLGHTSIAVDSIADICLGCPISASAEAALAWGGFETRFSDPANPISYGPSWSALSAGATFASGAGRRQVLRYESPDLHGFVFSADWGGDEMVGDDPRWSVALRYINEFNSIAIAGGIGYNREDTFSGWGGSLSLQHTPSGIFVAGSYSQETADEIVVSTFEDTRRNWSIAVGMNRKFSPIGATAVWGRYGRSKGWSIQGKMIDTVTSPTAYNVTLSNVHAETSYWAIGISQKIDPAAMEIYATYWHVSGDVYFDDLGDEKLSADDFQAIMFGSRIKF